MKSFESLLLKYWNNFALLRGRTLDAKKPTEGKLNENLTIQKDVIKGGELQKVSREDYYKFISHNLDDYSKVTYTPEETNKIQAHLRKLSTGSTAMVPLYCAGPACQVGSDTVLTKDGYKMIRELDPEKDLLLTWNRRSGCVIKKGSKFKIEKREYSGPMFSFCTADTTPIPGTTSAWTNHYFSCTPEHIMVARWNEKAQKNQFCVYLMEKDGLFRIGKTHLFKISPDGRFRFGPGERARAEKAGALWLLGIYETNTEALLAEESFSVKWQIPKALFISTPDRYNSNGLYKWISQEQLDKHHQGLVKDISHYAQCLASIGRSIDYPLWISEERRCECNKEKNKYGAFGSIFEIRACNFVSDYMDIPTYDGKDQKPIWKTAFSSLPVSWLGTVYSLDVEDNQTYITRGIVTHNCPFASRCIFIEMGKPPIGKQCIPEVQLINHWVMQYMEEYAVDPENFTEVSFCNELAEIEVMLRRLNMSLSRPENGELVIDQAVGVAQDGTPIIQKQLSPYMEQKDKLLNRKSKIVKLMVGDRQEKYKKEAALKQKEDQDPSSKQAEMRRKIEELQRSIEKIEPSTNQRSTKEQILTPDAILSASDD
jgi:hypothetical protein